MLSEARRTISEIETEILNALKAYGYKNGDVIEVRALGFREYPKARKSIASGWFDDIGVLARTVASIEDKADGWYITKNALIPDIINRRRNRIESFIQENDITQNSHVLRRTRLIIDLDPYRLSGIPSTDAEHKAAISKGMEIKEWLSELGWPEPVFISTGNGAALIYAIDLPVEDEKLEQRVLEVIRMLKSDMGSDYIVDKTPVPNDGNIRIDVDSSVYTLSRITRLPGTMNRKGDASPMRPHRRAFIISAPEKLLPVPIDALNSIASLHEEFYKTDVEAKGKSSSSRRRQTMINVDKIEAHFGLQTYKKKRLSDGEMIVYKNCPNDSSHKNTFSIIKKDDGGAIAICFHNSCGGNKDFMSDLIKQCPECVEKIESGEVKNSPYTIEAVKRMGITPKEGKNYENSVPDAAKLFEILQRYKYVKDQNNELYAVIPISNEDGIIGYKVVCVDSIEFKGLASVLFYNEYGKPPSKASLDSVYLLLYGKTNDKRFLKLRINGENMNDDENRIIWYDIGDDTYNAVKITKDNISIEKPPMLFYRVSTLLPQVWPDLEHPNINLIFKYLNVNIFMGDVENKTEMGENISQIDDYDLMMKERERDINDVKLLLVVVLLYNMIPDTDDYKIPRIGLNINGEKGSGKTELMWILKTISDPMQGGYISLPEKYHDLVQALISSNVVAIDNISDITQEMSDLLCGAATGTVIQKRALYTNHELVSIVLRKAVIMTGISSIIKKTDLADRYIFIDLKRIDSNSRRDHTEIEMELKNDMPSILGGCFKIISSAMRMYPTYKPIEVSRMPSFDRWGYCIAESIEKGGGERFKRIYKKLQIDRDANILNEGLVSQAICSIMERNGGVPKQTLRELRIHLINELIDNLGVPKKRIDDMFPATNMELRRELLNIKSNLMASGYLLELIKPYGKNNKYFVKISKIDADII